MNVDDMYDDPENAPIIIAIFSTHVFINASSDNNTGYERSQVCKRINKDHPIRSVSWPSRIIIETPPIVHRVMINYEQYELRKIPPKNEYVVYAVPHLTYQPSYARPLTRERPRPRGMQKPVPVPDYESAINDIINGDAVPVGHADLEKIYFSVSNGETRDNILNMTFEDPLVQLTVQSIRDGKKEEHKKRRRRDIPPDMDDIRIRIRPDDEDISRFKRDDKHIEDDDDDEE